MVITLYVLLVGRHIRKCVTQFGPKALFTPTNDCAGSHEKLKDRIHLYDLNGHGQYENDVFVVLLSHVRVNECLQCTTEVTIAPFGLEKVK